MRSAARAIAGRTSSKAALPHAPRGLFVFGLVALVGPSILLAAGASATPPGTPIVNVASVTASPAPGAPAVGGSSNPAVTLVAPPALGLEKRVEPAGTVSPGSVLRYTLVFENLTGAALTGLAITDPLDPWIAAVEEMTTGPIPDAGPGGGRVAASAAYDAAAREARWLLPAVPAGFRGELSLRVRLAAAIPDETLILNRFRASTDPASSGVASNTVVTPVVAPALAIELAVSRDRVEAGDPVGFTVRLRNVAPALDLTAAAARLLLPEGFRYLPGSLRAGGRGAPAPAVGAQGRELTLAAGDLPAGAAAELTLAAVAGAAVRSRETAARARGWALTPSGVRVAAGPAEAAIRVVDGLLAAEAVVAGRVFADADGDGRQSSGEAGVPGVRLYLEDGTQVLTDLAGRYHVEGVRPGLHVLKLDPATAPEGLRPEARTHRSAGSAGVQFLDLGASELFRADFSLGGDPEAMAAIRLDLGASGSGPRGGPTATAEDPPAPLLLAASLFDPGGWEIRPEAAAIVEACAQLLRETGAARRGISVTHLGEAGGPLAGRRVRALERALARSLDPAGAAARRDREVVAAAGGADPPAAAVPALRSGGAGGALDVTEGILRGLPTGLHLLAPRPGQILTAERVDVDVAFPAESRLVLRVGGEEVPEERIGVRMRTSRTGMRLHRYVGVELREGENVIVAEASGLSGGRARAEVRVERVGPPARIEIRGEGGAQAADGRTPGRAVIEVLDARGHAVADGVIATVEASSGGFLGADADPRREGFQVRTAGGRALVRLTPAPDAETRALRAAAGAAAGEGEIRFGPHLRDWIVAGVGEAGWSGGGGDASGRRGTAEDLEAGSDASARLAFFAKGRIGEKSLLGVTYDSGRARDEEALFREQDPVKLFPIYGDGSFQTYDLESQGKLGVRWERERTMLMYGDFRTGLGAAELARYDRPLSGGLLHVEEPGVTIHAFGAATPQRSVRDVFRADGSSGPFRLTRRPMVAYSESVILEVRDRFHTERVIATSPQRRFADYDVDHRAGTILFRSPPPAHDERFNPVSIVVAYETVDGASSNLVAGGRIGYRPSARFEWGTTAVHEQRGDSAFALRGTDLTFRPWAGAAITAEYAHAAESGRAAGAFGVRLTAAAGPRTTIGAYVRDVPADFANPSMTGVSELGSHKEGLEVRSTLPDGSRLLGEAFRQEEGVTGIERRAANLGWERTEGPVTYEAGARSLAGTTEGGGGEGSSGLLRAGLRARIGGRFDAGLARQEVVAGQVVSGFPSRTELGAGWRFSRSVRGFLRHEMDEGEVADTQRTLLGVEGALDESTTVESRYAIEDALTGARGYAVLGVRSRFALSDLWSADLRAERAETATGDGASDFTALSGAAEYLPAASKFTSRYEVRLGEAETRHLLTTSGALRLTQDMVLFARQRTSLSEPALGDGRLDADGLLGLAYRPVSEDRLNWLARLHATRGETLPGGGTSLAGAPAARGLMGVLEMNYQPAPRWHLLGRYAGRYARDAFAGLEVKSYTEVYEARILADAARRATLGLTGRLLRQAATETVLTGAGVESGFLVGKDLWLVAGYNVTGFSDERFPDGERRARGPFVSLRFKFDESLFAGLGAPRAVQEASAAGAAPAGAAPPEGAPGAPGGRQGRMVP